MPFIYYTDDMCRTVMQKAYDLGRTLPEDSPDRVIARRVFYGLLPSFSDGDYEAIRHWLTDDEHSGDAAHIWSLSMRQGYGKRTRDAEDQAFVEWLTQTGRKPYTPAQGRPSRVQKLYEQMRGR